MQHQASETHLAASSLVLPILQDEVMTLGRWLQGNVILTDSKYEVLTLLRSHRDDAKGVAIMARHPYPLQTVRLKIPVTAELVREALSAAEGASTLRSEVPTASTSLCTDLSVVPEPASQVTRLIWCLC